MSILTRIMRKVVQRHFNRYPCASYTLPYLSENTLRVFRNDMAEMYGMEERSGRDDIWGDPCDKSEWDKFTSAVIAEMQKREADNGNDD